jgi:hypothetical protein
MPSRTEHAASRVSCSLMTFIFRPEFARPKPFDTKAVRVLSVSISGLPVIRASVFRWARIKRGLGPKGKPTSTKLDVAGLI